MIPRNICPPEKRNKLYRGNNKGLKIHCQQAHTNKDKDRKERSTRRG